MLMSENEKNYLLSSIKPGCKFLEYGSGTSTIIISKMAQTLVSVEHDQYFYNKIKMEIPPCVKYILEEPTAGYQPLTDGTIDQFKKYVEAPLPYGPYDIIFIDGRARKDCAFLAPRMSHRNTKIFIHDFYPINPPKDRENYLKCLDIMDIIGSEGSMFEFKLKTH